MPANIGRLALSGAVLSLCIASAAPAWAVTSSAFTYSATRTGYYSISPMDLAPDSNASAATVYLNGWGTALTSHNGCFNAGVNLPQGARITAFTYVHGGSIHAFLTATAFSDGSNVTVFEEFSPPTAGRNVRTVAVVPAVTVSNAGNMYGVGFCVETGEAFYGARITYTYTSAGD